MKRELLATLVLLCVPLFAAAEPVPESLEPVQVTATRVAEPLATVPASLTVITGEELRRRGAMDLRSALAGVAGVEISPGGDNGPAGAVPAFWGLREFDAFLLVVDGVPSGGAFNPALTNSATPRRCPPSAAGHSRSAPVSNSRLSPTRTPDFCADTSNTGRGASGEPGADISTWT